MTDDEFDKLCRKSRREFYFDVMLVGIGILTILACWMW